MPYFRVNALPVGEGSGFVDVTVSLDQVSTNEIKVNYSTINATANYSSSQPDFQATSGTLVFAAGEATRTVRVNIANNTVIEGGELFWFELNTPINATIAQRLTPVGVFDNDASVGTPLVAVSDAVVDEGARTASFAVWLNRPSGSAVSVSYATADDSASVGQDYRSASGLLNFAPGEVVKTVTVDLIDDALAEPDEFFRLLLSNPGNATLADPLGQVQIGRNDAASQSQPYVTAQAVASGESQTLTNFVVQLSAPSSNEVRVNYDLLNATANYSSSQPDFQSHGGTLVFAPGQTTMGVAVPVVDNTVIEGTDMYWLALSTPVNAIVPQRLVPAFTFDNDAVAGVPRASIGDAVVDETAGIASFFVWLDKPATGVVTLTYNSVDDSAVAGQDYRGASGLLSFLPGETVKTVTVDVLEDAEAEPDEFFGLLLSNPGNATLTDALGQVQIGRNDGAQQSQPYITARAVAGDERQVATHFVVQLSAPSSNEVRVNYDLLNATADYSTSQPDFQSHSGTLVFAPGQTTKVVVVPVVDNAVIEGVGSYWLALGSPVNAVVSQRLTPALVFDNDAVAGTPRVSIGDAVVGETAGTASFFVWLDKPSIGVVTLNYNSADDTALAGQDYRAVSGVLNFAPGETVKTVTVDIFDDNLAEAEESFRLLLSDPSQATLVESQGQVRITRNDTAPQSQPYITVQSVASDEREALTNFVVQLSAPSSNEVRVNYDLLNATANYSSSQPDFQSHSGTLVFAPGQTAMVVVVPVVDNALVEAPDMFWLALGTPVNAVVAQRLAPAYTFDNDAVGGTPVVSIGDCIVDETAGTASFFVWLDKPSINVAGVTWATSDDSARAGVDYRAAAGVLDFAPGETVKTVTVDLIDDAVAEIDEAFQVLLSNPGGATLGDAAGGALIGRNDTARVSQPQLLATPVVASEADTALSFVVLLSAPSSNEVRVNYSLPNGTANYSSSQPDFQTHSGTLVFAPGQTTMTAVVPLIDNTLAEGTETFTLDLSVPVNATIPQRQTSATLIDTDSGFGVASRGLGNDTYTVGAVTDRIAESPMGGVDTVRASVSYTLPDNVENLMLTGSALNAIGNAGHNVFSGTASNNSFDGAAGIDTVVFAGPRSAYTATGGVASRTVGSATEGSDSLFSIERLQFSDSVIAYDTGVGGNTWGAYAMFNAAFDRAPGTAELSQWTAALDRSVSLRDLAQTMISHYAPGVPDDVLVSYLWGTLVGTAIPADALALYTGLLADGTYTQASLLELATTLELNTAEIVSFVGQPALLDPAWFVAPGA